MSKRLFYDSINKKDLVTPRTKSVTQKQSDEQRMPIQPEIPKVKQKSNDYLQKTYKYQKANKNIRINHKVYLSSSCNNFQAQKSYIEAIHPDPQRSYKQLSFYNAKPQIKHTRPMITRNKQQDLQSLTITSQVVRSSNNSKSSAKINQSTQEKQQIKSQSRKEIKPYHESNFDDIQNSESQDDKINELISEMEAGFRNVSDILKSDIFNDIPIPENLLIEDEI